jgi:signal transduction histidine kinase/ligand-binding sensor domain-containing protein/DNA-binding response OmpR family regulator
MDDGANVKSNVATMKRFFAALFFLLPSVLLAESYHFSRLDNTHGLSNNQVECIFKDSRGFVWFGTNFGLNRYDGYRVKVYQSVKDDTTSLMYHMIPRMQEDFRGNLWITGRPHYVLYDIRSDKFIRNLGPYLTEMGVHFIPDMVEIDKDQNFYFYQHNDGIYKYDVRLKKLHHFPQSTHSYGLSKGRMVSVKGGKGFFWVLYRSGLLERFNERLKKVDFRNHFVAEKSKGSNIAKTLFLDSEGCPWIFPGLGDKGALQFNLKKATWVYYGNNRTDFRFPYDQLISSDLVRDVAEDQSGNIWIATDHGGVDVLHKATGQWTVLRNDPMNPNSISQNSCISLFCDNDGIVWVGTYKNGVSFYHPGLFKFDQSPLFFFHHPQLETKDCNTLCEDGAGNLWIGTNGNGLLKWDRLSRAFRIYRHRKEDPSSISSDIVISMAEDHTGTMWFGTYMGGLNQMKGERFVQYLPDVNHPNALSNNSIYGLCEDVGGNLWMATLGGGVDQLDPTRKVFRRYDTGNSSGLSSNTVLSMWTNNRRDMYLSTTQGVDVLHSDRNEIFSIFDRPEWRNKLSDLIVYNTIQDSRGLFWMATDNGLNVYDPLKKIFRYIHKTNGLPSDQVVSLVEDNQGNIWAGTRNGLACIYPTYHRQTGKLVCRIVSFDENDGLPGSIINQNALYKNKQGLVYVGTTKGYSVFDPSAIRFNRLVPRPRFTDLRIANQEVGAGEKFKGRVVLKEPLAQLEKLVLHYDERNFTVSFSAMSYLHPEKNRYRYQLKGFDEEWNETKGGVCSASYTNLNQGQYELLVYASNNDNVWSKKPLTLKIVIRPPFWAAWWAILMYILLLLYGLWKLFDYKLKKQRKAFVHAQRMLEAKQLHEVDEMKFRFFTNISHEFRTPLTLILSPVEKMLKEARSEEDRSMLGMIQRNANGLLELVNQLLDFRKLDVNKDTLNISVGDVVGFVRDICHSFTDLANKKAISFTFTTSVTELRMEFDPEKFRKIMVNLLSNAFKFTKDGGQVDVLVALMEPANDGQKSLKITVKDTGIGIPAVHLEKVFERFYRVEHPDHLHQTGTGIGLHIVSEYVKLHQGDIGVQSTLGKGSVFTLNLPVVQHLEEEIIARSRPVVTDRTEPEAALLSAGETEDKRPLMLVVDDNDDFRFFLVTLFADRFKVLQAPNGDVAFRMILEVVPDIIICDVMMPKMDGFELCRLVKHDMRISHIPIVLLTAKAGDENKYRGLEAGAEDYIAKPFHMDMLLLKVNNIMERQQKNRAQFRRKVTVSPDEVEITPLDEKFVKKAVTLVEMNISNPAFLVEDLCREMGMSRVYFYKKIVALTDKTPSEFIRFIRLKRAADLLEKSQLFVNEVAFQVGFNDPKYFRKYFKDEFGLSPNDYKKRFLE